MKIKDCTKLALLGFTMLPLFLGSCTGSYTFLNLKCSDTFFVFGDQEVTISVQSDSENQVTFKETISKNDVVFSYLLEGRVASSVTYLSPTSIKVGITGKVSENASGDLGYFTVNPSGITSGATCFGVSDAPIYPSIYSEGVNLYFKNGGVVVRAQTSFKTNFGSFIFDNVNATNITLEETTGVLTITKNIENNSVTLKVENWTIAGEFAYPKVKFAANTWTLNKSNTVLVGKIGTYPVKQ